MLDLLASADPYKHTWDGWVIEAYGLHFDLRHVPGFEALGITKAVVMLFVAAAALLAMGVYAGNRAKAAQAAGRTTRGFAGFIEVFVEFIRNDLMRPEMPHHYKSPLFISTFCTFFFFILICNLLGLLPPPLGFTSTGVLMVCAGLSFGGTLVLMVGAGMKEHGVLGYPKHLIPGGVPWWLVPLIAPIEVMGLIIKPFALTIRLTANMKAGHIILAVLSGFLAVMYHGIAMKALVWLPSAFGFAAITLFEIFIAFVQAYIFTILSCVFVGQAVAHEH